MTTKELIEILKKYPDNSEIDMCMDWTMLEDCPEHLNQQWEDGLGDVAFDGERVILLNKNFR